MKFLPKIVDSQFLIRVIKDEISPEEREFFDKWIEESDENKEEFSNISLLWDKFQHSNLPELPDPELQWDKITASLNSSLQEPAFQSVQLYAGLKIEKAEKFSFSSAVEWVYKIAAVIILGAALYLLGDSVKNTSLKENTVPKTQEYLQKFATVATGKGEKATLTLADGSIIQLNSLSRLRYPDFFKPGSREVEFEGEGYFKIARDKKNPFRVKCNNAVTEVTGTEFNIRTRENKFSITVVEGSVKTFAPKEPGGVDVKKGEMITLRSTGNFTRPVKVSLSHFPAWRENKISFSRTPLYEAAAELERNYNNLQVIILSDSIKGKTITGVFNTNSLDEILRIFGLTLDIRITRKGDKIYFE